VNHIRRSALRVLLPIEWTLSHFDGDLSRAQKAYRRFVQQRRGVEIRNDLKKRDLSSLVGDGKISFFGVRPSFSNPAKELTE